MAFGPAGEQQLKTQAEAFGLYGYAWRPEINNCRLGLSVLLGGRRLIRAFRWRRNLRRGWEEGNGLGD